MSEPTPATAPALANAAAAPNSVSPELPRPALADRQCDQRQEQSAKQANARKNTPQGAKQVPRAGTFSNSRLPRPSSTSNLPRGRSFQGVRPLSPEAQKAQDFYFQRKAAKLYAERRRAKAEKEAKENDDTANGNVINITVDAKGVKIDNGKGTPQGNGQGMGSRRNSRSRMSRSNSRQWNNRPEDKENRHESGQRNTDVEKIDAYFNRKRGSVDPRRNRESFGGANNGASWDGSMPKRQNSKSFIEKRRESMSAKSTAEDTSKTDGKTQLPAENDENAENTENDNKQVETKTESGSDNPKPKQSDSATLSTVASTPAKKPEADVSVEASNPDSPTLSSVSESGTEDTAKTVSPSTSKHGKRETSDTSPPESGTPEAQKVPLHGKWCDDCAGLGLHIAALLSELEKQRTGTESGADNPSASSGSKKGWKNIVLGDTKSKSSSEKARLQQEVNVLKASVDFLYKKIEQMEASNSRESK